MTEKPVKIGSWLCLPKQKYNASSLVNKLTISPYVSEMAPVDQSTIVELYEEDRDYIYVPRCAPFVTVDEYEDHTEHGADRNMGAPITLRDYQEPLVNEYLTGLEKKSPHGGMLCAAAGAGKTVMGLEVIRRLGKTTVILVHKEFLVNQWVERIEQFLPDARVGRVQQDTCEYGDDYDIVICMIQSLAAESRTYPDDFYRWAGVVVSDECHRLGAETWSNVIAQFPAKVRVGLTATPRRKDAMEPVFFWHIGPILAQARREDTKTMEPLVRMLDFKDEYPLHPFIMRNGKFNMSKWVTAITEHPRRNEMIMSYLKAALEKGRKVLLLSDRRDHLDFLEDEMGERMPGLTIGQYVGQKGSKKKAKETLDAAAACQLVLGTFKMAEEGLDIRELDCLFLCTPKSDVEQAVGRVQRTLEGKKQPIVIDIVDSYVGAGVGMSAARKRIYARLNAKFI